MREQVEKTIEVIRPALHADGGDIVLHDVDEATGIVTVELTGACVGCPASTQTLKAGIERIMRDPRGRRDLRRRHRRARRRRVTSRAPTELFAAAAGGDRTAKARLLSLIERGGEAARDVGRLAAPQAGRAYTIGLTGAPGAGKSTLTSALIALLRSRGEEVAVLAVDPSSPFTGGAILGDRVRMQDHATDPGVFIRSMATRGHLGGLALAQTSRRSWPATTPRLPRCSRRPSWV